MLYSGAFKKLLSGVMKVSKQTTQHATSAYHRRFSKSLSHMVSQILHVVQSLACHIFPNHILFRLYSLVMGISYGMLVIDQTHTLQSLS